MEGEKDEEQIAEETDIKNKWSESEEERKKKQAMRRSDELIKLQTKPMQLRSKQAAYEVDPEMDEGEEKITRQLPAGAVGALKAFKELQRGFPWKQKWNGKEAEAPPKKSGALMTHGGRRMTHGGRRMQTSRVARTGGISRHHRLHHLRRPGLHHLRRPDQGSQPKGSAVSASQGCSQRGCSQRGCSTFSAGQTAEKHHGAEAAYVPASTAKATHATASDTTTGAKACSVRIPRVGIDADHAKRSSAMPEGWLLLAQQRGVCGSLRAVPHVPWPLLILNV